MLGYKPAGHGYNGVQYISDITSSVGNIIHEGECVEWQSTTDSADEVVIKCVTANSAKFRGVLVGKDSLDLTRLDASGDPTAHLGAPLSLAGDGDEAKVKMFGTCSKGDLLITHTTAAMKKLIYRAPLAANIANNATSLTIFATDLPDGVGFFASGNILKIGGNLFTIGTVTGPAGGPPTVYTVPLTLIAGGGAQVAHVAGEICYVLGTYHVVGRAAMACATSGLLKQVEIMNYTIEVA